MGERSGWLEHRLVRRAAYALQQRQHHGISAAAGRNACFGDVSIGSACEPG